MTANRLTIVLIALAIITIFLNLKMINGFIAHKILNSFMIYISKQNANTATATRPLLRHERLLNRKHLILI